MSPGKQKKHRTASVWLRCAIAGLIGVSLSACGTPDPESGAETGDLEPLVGPSQVLEDLSGFAGEFVVIDARMASDVASMAMPAYQAPIGKRLNFTYRGIEMEGAACEAWRVTALAEPILFVDSDPNLVDLRLGPTESPVSVGDHREHQGYAALCEGEEVFRFHKVDDRVLVMPTENSAVNLILERPLTELQIKAYQAQLKSMKFYDDALTGQLDEATLRASRQWFEYRASLDETQPIPARPAITENLLDALNVIDNG